MIHLASRRPALLGVLECAARSDTGRARDHNEDRVAADSEGGVAVLADGMGGHKGGEIASGLAVETITQELGEHPVEDPDTDSAETAYAPESMAARASVLRANTIVYETARTQPQYEGMGTTVVAALFYDDRLTIAHVGDSRAYRVRGEGMEQLTCDHTLVEELIERGFYTREEAHSALNRNIITRALGIEPSVDVDLLEEIVLPGDIYLLCSDGLTDMLDDDTIRHAIKRAEGTLEQAADRLIELANENGGEDNVSVVLIRVLKPFSIRRGWFRRFVDWFQ